MSSNVVLIGKISDYQSNFNLLNSQIQKEFLNVVGIVLEESNYLSLDNMPVYSSLTEIQNIDFDYFILLTDNNEYYNMISEENDFKQKIIPIRVFNLPYFDFNKYQQLLENPPSIISRHCWGGLVLHSLGLRFNTPFINLFLNEIDFNKLVSNFSHYMNQELEFVQEGFDPILESNYPIVKLDDITLHFNHYPTFEEANNKWNERKKRLDYDNLFFETTTEYKSVALQFKSFDLNRKICFCVDDIEGKGMINCVDMMPEFSKGSLGMFVNGTATGEIPYFNLIDLLLNYDYSSRIEIAKKTNNEREYNYYKTTHLYALEYNRFFGLDAELPWNLNDKVGAYSFIDKLGIKYPRIYYKLNNIEDLKQIEHDLPSKFIIKNSIKSSAIMLLTKKGNHYIDGLTSKSLSVAEIINEMTKKLGDLNEINSYYLIEEVTKNFTDNMEIPLEYKVFSFNGIPKIILQLNRNSTKPIISLFDGDFIPLKEGRDWFINEDLAEEGLPIIPPSAYKILSQSMKVSKQIEDKYVMTSWADDGKEPVFKELSFANNETFTGLISFSREILLNLENSLNQELYVDYLEKGYRIHSSQLYEVLNQELNFDSTEYYDLLMKYAENSENSIDISSYFEKLVINEENTVKKRLYQHLEMAWLEIVLLNDNLLTEKLCRQINAGWGFVFLKTYYYQQRINESKQLLFKKSDESDWYKIRWAQFILDLGGTPEEINQAKNYVDTHSKQGMDYAINVKNKYGL